MNTFSMLIEKHLQELKENQKMRLSQLPQDEQSTVTKLSSILKMKNYDIIKVNMKGRRYTKIEFDMGQFKTLSLDSHAIKEISKLSISNLLSGNGKVVAIFPHQFD